MEQKNENKISIVEFDMEKIELEVMDSIDGNWCGHGCWGLFCPW